MEHDDAFTLFALRYAHGRTEALSARQQRCFDRPAVGRFTARDSVEGDRSRPSTLNLYLAMGGDSVNKTDPSGNDAIGEVLGGAINVTVGPMASATFKYVRRGMVFFDDTKPQLPDLNSPYLVANYHSILIKNSIASVDTLFAELQRLPVEGANASPLPVAGVGQRIGWRITTAAGFLGQDSFYVSTTKFANRSGQSGPVDHLFSVVTMGGHPLRGWRFWRVYKTEAGTVVETGAVEEPNGAVNRIKAGVGGNTAILDLWGTLMQQIKTVSGGTLWAMMDGNMIVLKDEKGGMSKVTQANVNQSNGVIHVVDSVVIPN